MKETHEYVSRGTSSSIPVDSCLKCGKSEEAHLGELTNEQVLESVKNTKEKVEAWLIKRKYDYKRYPFLLTILVEYIEDPST